MKIQNCEKCGGGEFIVRDGYRICQYCSTKYLITVDDAPLKKSNITLENDIEMLLQKCRDDPLNARRYASLVLDLDPSNDCAKNHLQKR